MDTPVPSSVPGSRLPLPAEFRSELTLCADFSEPSSEVHEKLGRKYARVHELKVHFSDVIGTNTVARIE